MTFAATYDYTINHGETWLPVFRWGTGVLASKPISAISQAAPMVVTATGHGVPDGWPAAVVSAGGMTQANADRFPPVGDDWAIATLVDANNVSFNKVSSASYSPYTSGGFLVYYTPQDLSLVTAATLVLYSSPTHDDTAPVVTLAIGSGIVLDNTAKTISATWQSGATAAGTYYYELRTTVGTTINEIINGALNILP